MAFDYFVFLSLEVLPLATALQHSEAEAEAVSYALISLAPFVVCFVPKSNDNSTFASGIILGNNLFLKTPLQTLCVLEKN